MSMRVKQIVCVRQDLKMCKGKYGAQGGHAVMKPFFDRITNLHDLLDTNITKQCGSCRSCHTCEDIKGNHNPNTYPKDCPKFIHWKHDHIRISLPHGYEKEWIAWITGQFTKIFLKVKDLDELFDIHAKAEAIGMPHAIIEDSGLTVFKEDCKHCKGTGKVSTDLHKIDCSWCGSTGKVNKPTITCLSLGPADASKLDPITGHLELFL